MTTTHDIQRWTRMLVRGQVPPPLRSVDAATVKRRLPPDAATAVLAYAADFPAHRRAGHGLYLMGEPSTGKATAAVYVLKCAIKANCSVLLIDTDEARMALVRPNGTFAFDGEVSAMERLRSVDVLCFTHLGDERKTEEFVATVGALLRWRASRRRPTLVTTYLPTSKVKALYGLGFASVLESAFTVVSTDPEAPLDD